jgi:hypothetical protein
VGARVDRDQVIARDYGLSVPPWARGWTVEIVDQIQKYLKHEQLDRAFVLFWTLGLEADEAKEAVRDLLEERI